MIFGVGTTTPRSTRSTCLRDYVWIVFGYSKLCFFAGKRFFRVGFRIGRRNNHSVELGFLLVCYLENSRWIRTRIIGSVGAWLELVASQLVALRDSEVSLAACCRCLHSDNVC